MRTRVDPRLVGVERQVLRAGGHTTTTPWWALVLYAVVALLVLAALNMIADLVRQAALATSLGGMGVLLLAVRWTFGFLQFALLVPLMAALIGLLLGFRITRLPDPEPSAAAESLLAG